MDCRLHVKASVADIGDLSVFKCRHRVDASFLLMCASDPAAHNHGERIKPGSDTFFVCRKKCPDKPLRMTDLSLIDKFRKGFSNSWIRKECRVIRCFRLHFSGTDFFQGASDYGNC